ncbi:hypothetical protein Dsui_2837 [Azospira oryzae PS]|uniref:Uncharacterized protein n=1 Tax=Azospira oryzae (strain ATCC BAA-33 / DSM 13638 / PS) TaxID=640081 RepID=G8QFR3_AZOOP|nr:hypothetical protein [Azospira oryzae]AEV27176.1 hypothetical protein Dsui_2837 [Azospira oryzae PS]
MNEQWPSERRVEEQKLVVDGSFKTTEDFLALLNTIPNGLPRVFDDAVIWIVEQDGDLSELERRIASVVDAANLHAYPDNQPLLMTFACAAALAHTPSLHTWDRVSTFQYNSWQLENWLDKAMTAYAKATPPACHNYVALAREVFAGLDDFSLQSKSDRINQERFGARASWNECRNKLDEIWWGLRNWHGFMNYEEVLPLFQVFYELSPDEFIDTLRGSSNPYLVSALMFVAGIGAFSPRFSEWKRMLAAAPVAFEADGKWNGSVLIPLLLVEARNQLLQVRQNFKTLDPSSEELDGIKQEIADTAEVIATALAARRDANAIFSRWTPWLMRQVLSHTSKDLSDVKSLAFADDALIDAIAQRLGNCTLPETSPADAGSWESWCYRCTLSSFAYNEHISVPAWEDFGNEWRLEPEDWAGKKGLLLREHASLITSLNKETPGIAANLLAYPIAQSPSPAAAWIHLWNDAITLREIVEFGDSDATADEYSSRSEAGQLLLLLFRIGLAIFDQGAAKCSSSRSSEEESLVDLYKALASAERDMREIDRTLNRDEWFSVVQHLTVRRVIWELPSSDGLGLGYFQVFKPDDTPTVVDLLTEAKGNVIELFAILQSLMLNIPDVSRLKRYLSSASISLPDVVCLIRRLNQFHPRKYPINEDQLQKLADFDQ